MKEGSNYYYRQQWGILRNRYKVRRGNLLSENYSRYLNCHYEKFKKSPCKICARSLGNTGRANVIQNDWVKKVRLMKRVKKGDKRIANGRMKIRDICWNINSANIYLVLTNII